MSLGVTVITIIERDPNDPNCFPNKDVHLFLWGFYIFVAFLINVIMYKTIFFSSKNY